MKSTVARAAKCMCALSHMLRSADPVLSIGAKKTENEI
jgi:hypothetical protein